MRCACYYRVSRADAERGISIDVQREICEAFALAQGWTIMQSYRDDGKSAYTDQLDKRPAFQQMMTDARAKHFMSCWSISMTASPQAQSVLSGDR